MDNRQQQPKEFDEKVIEIKRLSKKTKGGNKITFSALVVIGNTNGQAGVGLAKAKDVLSAIQKSIRMARKNLIRIPMTNGTIPHEIMHKRGAAIILLKPAPEGTGVIAGGAVRAVVEAFGIKNIVSKCMGTANKVSNVYGTFEALQNLQQRTHHVKTVNDVKEPEAQTEKKPTQETNVKPVSKEKKVRVSKTASKKTK